MRFCIQRIDKHISRLISFCIHAHRQISFITFKLPIYSIAHRHLAARVSIQDIFRCDLSLNIRSIRIGTEEKRRGSDRGSTSRTLATKKAMTGQILSGPIDQLKSTIGRRGKRRAINLGTGIQNKIRWQKSQREASSRITRILALALASSRLT